jgi:hypothetical protein
MAPPASYDDSEADLPEHPEASMRANTVLLWETHAVLEGRLATRILQHSGLLLDQATF